MKNGSDTRITKGTKRKGQFARFAKVRKELSCGQGTDSQEEEKVDKDEWLESKTKKQKWL